MHLVYTRLKVQYLYSRKIGGLITASGSSDVCTDRSLREYRRDGLSGDAGETFLNG